MEFIEKFDYTQLKPADYNPRKIDPDSFETLKYSLKTFGIVKPVIINGLKGILTAGHQRTKACKAVGITSGPAIRLMDISTKDEIRFNLFHNKVEYNKSKVKVVDPQNLPFGFSWVDHSNIERVETKNAIVVHSLCEMISKYDEWGSVVIDEDGNVIDNSEYACAISILRKRLLVYKLKNKDVPEFLDLMSRDYGEYNYATLGIKNYNQTFCQLHRLNGGINDSKSSTYEGHVLPYVKKEHRIVDFGAGEAAYINMLKSQGYQAWAYEPYPKYGNSPNIRIKLVLEYLKELGKTISQDGLFDVVVLDSVINSVTSLEMENYVLTTCNALQKADGIFFMGTRSIELTEELYNHKIHTQKNRGLQFLDKNNFTATFRNGVWTMQRFHRPESLKETLGRYWEDVTVHHLKHKKSMLWAECRKPKQLGENAYIEALNVEFNMEYPGDYRHNRHKGIVNELIKRVKER